MRPYCYGLLVGASTAATVLVSNLLATINFVNAHSVIYSDATKLFHGTHMDSRNCALGVGPVLLGIRKTWRLFINLGQRSRGKLHKGVLFGLCTSGKNSHQHLGVRRFLLGRKNIQESGNLDLRAAAE